MLSILTIALFIILRIVIPVVLLLAIGESIRRYDKIPGNPRGA
ncbi:hypothetical protein ACFLXB_06140 [Chloroflexota bacterium]